MEMALFASFVTIQSHADAATTKMVENREKQLLLCRRGRGSSLSKAS